MTGCVEIWAAPAGAGKTNALLALYRSALKAGQERGEFGRTLWLTPTKHSRRQILESLPDESLTVCAAPNVFTFESCADRILDVSSENVAKLSPASQRRLLRTIIDELRDSDRLAYFSPIAKSTGFLQLVLSFIAELKREEIWPEQFDAACQSRGHLPKDRELAEIYTVYQERLQTAGRYDGEGRFWSARDAVERSGLGPFAELSLVVVDGFTDFTHTQYELLAHIGNSSQQMRISLPLELPLKRSGLFAKSQTALTRLQAIFAEEAAVRSEFPQSTTASQLPAVAHLSANLFDNPRHVERLPDADGIELLATAGPIREMEAIALRVKQLLLAGSVPAEIVVAFRSLEESAELLQEIFTAAGIPFHCEAGFLLSRSPVLKALFDVVRLECEDWPFERLLAVLRSNFFRPDWDVFKNERAVSALAAQLRNRKLHTQRTVMLRVLRREKTRLESNPDETDPDEFESISSACELLEQLSSATQRLRGETDFRGWCERVLQLGRELGIASDETDAQTWGDFERILFDAAKTDEFSAAPVRKLKLAEFHQAVREMIEGHELPQPEESRRCVRILDAGSVRNLDVTHLLLGGLTEANYPRSRADDCLYGETERRTLNEQGLTLRQRSSHEEDELLLFYGVLTRARKSLTITFPEMGVNGQPLFPSPYLKAIESLFEPGAVAVEQVGQLDPVPPRASVLSDSDLRRVATAEVGNGSSGLFAAMCRQPQTQPAAENILASVDANCARFQTRGWTDYEGRLFDVDLRARVAGRFPADHQFSATQLESYASCGFRFFMSDVLKISPLETPQAGTDYLRRGVLVHRVLSLLHAEPRSAESDDAELIDVENDAAAMSGEFRRQVDELVGRRIDETELLKALTEVERRLLHDWADIYSEQWEQYQSGFSQTWDAAPKPMQLEAAFGDVPGEPNESKAGEEAAVISADILKIGTGDATTFIRGRIDRIDVGRVDSQPVFNVIDYKIGRPPRFRLEDVEAGRALQLALYTLAVLRFELAGRGAKPFQMGYWSLRETGFVSGLKGTRTKSTEPLAEDVFASLEIVLEELIPRLADSIRDGRFPVDSDDPDCGGRCPYHGVCRITQIRPIREALEKGDKLTTKHDL